LRFYLTRDNDYDKIRIGDNMSDEKDIKPNDGSLMENYIRFRISTDDKEKLRDYFGTFSDMREFVIDFVDSKGDDVINENKQ